MPAFIKQTFIVLALVLLLIDLNPNELHYYPFMISLDGFDGNCNTDKDPFVRICVPTKIEDVNFKEFNMIKGINGSKTLIKYNLLCEYRCEFDGKKCNTKQKWNNLKCQYEYKNPINVCIRMCLRV